MNIKIMAMIIMFFICSCLASADEPQQSVVFQNGMPAGFKTWDNFKVNSDNGIYTAEVKASAIQQSISPDKKTYVLNVYNAAGGNRQLFWQCDYAYDGYPAGMLTNDGTTFVYVNKYYDSKKPMVKIYRLGERIVFLYSNSFNINLASLKTDNNEKLWLDQDLWGYRFFYRGEMSPFLEITTIDKVRYYISLESGKITEEK